MSPSTAFRTAAGDLVRLRDAVNGLYWFDGINDADATGTPTDPETPEDLSTFGARLFSASTAQWTELPALDGGQIQPTYPTPGAPGAGETQPRIVVEGSVITANAGTLYEGKTLTWQVDNEHQPWGTSRHTLAGQTMLARVSRGATQVRLLADGTQVGAWDFQTFQSGLVEGGTFVPVRAGGRANLVFGFVAYATGTLHYRWEPLSQDAAELAPSLTGLEGAIDTGAGMKRAITLPLTPPSDLTESKHYVFRVLLWDAEQPDVVQVSPAAYAVGLPPTSVEGYAYPTPGEADDRIPVPAGALGADVSAWPVQQPADDTTGFTSEQAVAALWSQMNPTGLAMNVGSYGIATPVVESSAWVQARPYDAQHKIAAPGSGGFYEPGYKIGTGNSPSGQLVAPQDFPKWLVPALGTDGTVEIYDRTSHATSALWKARLDELGQWMATHGGFKDMDEGGATFPTYHGVSAAGIMQAPVVLNLFEVKAMFSRIDAGQSFDDLVTHSLIMALPWVRNTGWSYPAVRTDGRGTAKTEPLMGARFRLKKTVDLAAEYAAGRITRMAFVVGRFAQLRGVMVTDTLTGGGPAIIGQAFPWAQVDGIDPWKAVMDGQSSVTVLQGLNDMTLWEALPPNYGKPGTASDGAGEPKSLVMPPPVEFVEPEPPAPSVTTLLADSFARTLASGWGSAETGGVWTVWPTTAAAGATSVDGSAGVITTNPNNGGGAKAMAVVSGDSTQRIVFAVDALPVGANLTVQVKGREHAEGSARAYTSLAVRVTTAGAIEGQWRTRTSADTADVAVSNWTPLTTVTAGQQVTLVTHAATDAGTLNLSAKAWAAVEPEAWQVTGKTTAAELVGKSGTAIVEWYQGGTVTNAMTVRFHEWTITEPAPAPAPGGTGTGPASGETATVQVDGATATMTSTEGA